MSYAISDGKNNELSMGKYYRIYLTRYREESTLMSYAISDGKDNELRMSKYIQNLPQLLPGGVNAHILCHI